VTWYDTGKKTSWVVYGDAFQDVPFVTAADDGGDGQG
jgi:hypothetical protein